MTIQFLLYFFHLFLQEFLLFSQEFVTYHSLSDRNPLSRIPVACLSVMAFSGFVLYNFVTGIPYQEFLLHVHISKWYSRSLEVTFFYPAKHVIFCEWKGRLVMMTMIGWNKFTNVYSRKKNPTEEII